MNQFINARDTLVTEALDGLLRGSGGRLARLDGYPHVKVIVRSDWPARDGIDRVAVISGGGSGHEPAHAGFVGEGLLTAAVCGEVFASPSVDAVLAGILAVTGPAGCLLVVKNYTGDRLNFGLAAARARALGKRVEMVVVDDDVALPDAVQARGVAGTLFVHKVAGALAAGGVGLDRVAAAARSAIGRLASIGMSLDTCTIPGSPKEQRIAAGQAELGLGIHGEPGSEKVAFEGARAAVALVAARLKPHLAEGRRHALLLNNLGGCTPLEMAVLAEELCRSELAPALGWMIGPAPLMTSLDMRGFSVSLLALQDGEETLLAAPTGCPAWAPLRALSDPEVRPLPDGLAPPRFRASADPAMRALVERCCTLLAAREAELNALDAKVGDGDTGSTLATAARG
ncbi:dihydroxyacetone kinase subunit DhaK, partial [Thalassobaculum sp.]|uniref:dihydroxyacetone kinase subunit DhaK n=1 Tax=Thalassobaculum sp. TaxID=2022740 RepID=UPI0032EF381C